MAINIDNYIPMYIRQTEDKRPKNMVTSDHWNELFNLNILQGDAHSEVIVDIIAQLKAAQDLEAAHIARLDNPHSVNNVQVGLGNVTNDRQATKLEFDGHTSNVANPHSVNKTQVGLPNVDNTTDMNKPVSTAQAVALGTKVDKVAGKSLLADTEINRLLGIAAGAEVNVQTDWNVTDNTSDAFLKNKPVLGSAAFLNTGTTTGTIPLIGAGNKIAVELIPASAITDVQAFATIALRDAWAAASTGDIAIVTETSKTYIKSGATWLEMKTPTDLVTSVAGRNGAIVLTAADVSGALTALDILNALNSTATNKALSAAQGKALKDAADTLATQFNDFVTAYGVYTGSVETRFASAVLSPTITDIRYYDNKFEYSTDDRATWYDLTGAKGDTGKGYNPRGPWVPNGTYTNDAFTIDVVDDNGASFYCKTTHTDSAIDPRTDSVNWGIMSDITQLNAVIATEEIPPVLVSTNPVGLTVDSILHAGKVVMTGYVKPAANTPIADTDTLNEAVGKLEQHFDAIATTGADVVLTGYKYVARLADILPTTTVNEAINQLVYRDKTTLNTIEHVVSPAEWTPYLHYIETINTLTGIPAPYNFRALYSFSVGGATKSFVYNGVGKGLSVIYFSDDLTNWTKISPSLNLKKIQYREFSGQYYAVAVEAEVSTLVLSSNGIDWTVVAPLPTTEYISDMLIVGSWVYLLDGNNNLYQSSNGGVTWSGAAALPVESEYVSILVYKDNNLFAVGSTMLLINDFGGPYVNIPLPDALYSYNTEMGEEPLPGLNHASFIAGEYVCILESFSLAWQGPNLVLTDYSWGVYQPRHNPTTRTYITGVAAIPGNDATDYYVCYIDGPIYHGTAIESGMEYWDSLDAFGAYPNVATIAGNQEILLLGSECLFKTTRAVGTCTHYTSGPVKDANEAQIYAEQVVAWTATGSNSSTLQASKDAPVVYEIISDNKIGAKIYQNTPPTTNTDFIVAYKPLRQNW